VPPCSPPPDPTKPVLRPSADDSAIADTGASGYYLTPRAPCTNINPRAAPILVGAAGGAPHRSSASCDVPLPQLPTVAGHVMPTFHHNLMGIGPLCDQGCRVLFEKKAVTVFSQEGSVLLSGWREKTGAKLWRFSLLPNGRSKLPAALSSGPASLNAHDLPSVAALVKYLHACAGFPVKSTWLAAIKAGNFASWPGLSYANASKYCPVSVETLRGHMVQSRKGTRSTKPKLAAEVPLPDATSQLPAERSQQLFIVVEPISKLYTDDMGRFPVRSRSGNHYIMLAYHADCNVILVEAFESRHDRHRVAAYDRIMERLKRGGHSVDLQVLDNEASALYKLAITGKWNCRFQLVPPDVHRRNVAERAIRTFKAHFLSILAGVSDSFPNYLWDHLLPQTELTLNLLRQSTLAPEMSAWEHFHGPFNFDATPLGPLGCPIIIHNKPGRRKSWDFRGRGGFNVGPALSHYRCFHVVDGQTKALRYSDTVEFLHDYLTQPTVTEGDRIVHALNFLSCAVKDAPATFHHEQLTAISKLRDLFNHWVPRPAAPPPEPSPSPPTPVPPTPAARRPPPVRSIRDVLFKRSLPSFADLHPRIPIPRAPAPPPRVDARLPSPVADEPIARRTRSAAPPPRVVPIDVAPAPVAHRTRSRRISPVAAASRVFPSDFLSLWAASDSIHGAALSVLDPATGKSLEHRALRRHPRLGPAWATSYSNELGRLCQGIGSDASDPAKQRVEGTDTFHVLRYEDIPPDRRKGVAFSKVVCNVKPEKSDPNRTRITIAGQNITYPGDVGTKTASLDLIKLILNSVLSRRGAKFVTFDIKNFYLQTPLDRPEYVRIQLSDIPQEFIVEYNLLDYVHVNGWIYFEIRNGVYGLPQSGALANALLEKRLKEHDYYQCSTTPGLWRHKWRPIVFCLLVDDFGVEYVGERHALHLKSVLERHYEVTVNWKGDLYSGINLDWDYVARTCHLSMRDYVANLRVKFDHPFPSKPQHSPYKHAPIIYGAKVQYATGPDDSTPLDKDGVKRVQAIVGALLYYARAVDNKLLVALSELGQQQAAATEATNDAINQLLDYVATYPADGITYRASDMVLSAHSDAAYLNVTKARSRAGAHIMLSEDAPVPTYNGPVLTVAQIIKTVMSSAAEAELGGLYICAKEMVPLRQSLIEMGWPQPRSPIQCDNSTAIGVANQTIIPRKTKSMDMQFHWLRCRDSQGQFRYFWAPGATNLGDYSTKNHPPIYHIAQRKIRQASLRVAMHCPRLVAPAS
jgi:hypothetical protein